MRRTVELLIAAELAQTWGRCRGGRRGAREPEPERAVGVPPKEEDAAFCPQFSSQTRCRSSHLAEPLSRTVVPLIDADGRVVARESAAAVDLRRSIAQQWTMQ